MSEPVVDEAAALSIVTELVELEQAGVRLRPLVLGPWSAYVLVSALQLVLRHPDYADGGALADIIEGDARQLVGLFEPDSDSPVNLQLAANVRELLNAGFDRSQDVPA